MSAEDCCKWMLRFDRTETRPALETPARRAAASTAG
jgi:hypothetical protein